MDQIDKFDGVVEASPKKRRLPMRLAGSALGPECHCHICAFFSTPDDEYRTLLPFVKEGLELGEKAFHVVDPERQNTHIERLRSAGIDVTAAKTSGQLEIRTWIETHSRDGQFSPDRTLDFFAGVVAEARRRQTPLMRFVTHMGWASNGRVPVDDLLEYEAKANYAWRNTEAPVNPVVCTYNLNEFGGDVVVDIMRTHPMIIVGGTLRENPFYAPPEKFLKELHERRARRTKLP